LVNNTWICKILLDALSQIMLCIHYFNEPVDYKLYLLDFNAKELEIVYSGNIVNHDFHVVSGRLFIGQSIIDYWNDQFCCTRKLFGECMVSGYKTFCIFCFQTKITDYT
jgi:hypothetical protein